jgi:cobalamin biosynthesis protein CobD/CbiB
MKKEDCGMFLAFFVSIGLTLLIHYFLISRFDLHPTLHVFISLIILWFILTITALINERKKKNKKLKPKNKLIESS